MATDKTHTKEIRQQLKKIISEEINNLPNTLKELEPKQRLEIISKLLPYALPKTDPVKFSVDEPDDFWDIYVILPEFRTIG